MQNNDSLRTDIIKFLKQSTDAVVVHQKLPFFLKKAKVAFRKTYSDYEGTEFYKVIKAYEVEDDFYVMTVVDIEDMRTNKIQSMEVFILNEKPVTPHDLFPILSPTRKAAKRIFVFE